MSKATSRKLEISNCLRYWGPIKKEIETLIVENDITMAGIMGDYVSPDKLSQLNEALLLKKALNRVLLIEESLKEDLHEEELSKDSE